MTSPRLHPWALSALLIGATGIGFAPILVRVSEVGASATAGYRVLLALPFLWGWWWREHRRHPHLRRPKHTADLAWLALSGLLFTADLAIWHWSLLHTSVANSTLLTNLAPVLVVLGAWAFLGETITRLFVLGLFLAITGACLLVGLHTQVHRSHLTGDLLALLAAIFYAGYLLSVKQLRARFDGLTIMAWTGLVSAPGFFAVAWLTGETCWPQSIRGWWVVLGLAWISHLGGQTLIAFALGHLPASYSSVGLLLQPVVAALLAWMLFQEPLSAWQCVGGMLVLLGIGLATRPANLQRSPSQT